MVAQRVSEESVVMGFQPVMRADRLEARLHIF